MRLTFRFDRGLLRWAFFSALALGVQGCSDPCSDTFVLYETTSTPSAAQGSACDVTFSNGDRVAHYSIAPPASFDGGIASPEGGTCNESDTAPRVPCVALAGPSFARTTSCFRIACSFQMTLITDDAHALADFLKSSSFEMTLTCGGTIVRQDTLTFTTRECGL